MSSFHDITGRSTRVDGIGAGWSSPTEQKAPTLSSKTCTSCVYYRAESPDFANAIPACVRFGTPLGLTAGDSTGTRASLARSVAASCAGYLDVADTTTTPVAITKKASHNIAESTNVVKASKLSATYDAPHHGPLPASCSKCRWYIDPKTALKGLGVGFGVCGAFGDMVGPKELSTKAASCEFKFPGANLLDVAGLYLDPKFEVGLAAAADDAVPGKLEKYDHKHHMTDPRKYVSDREVTPADLASGIKAWRKVNEPSGTCPAVFMPIFDWEAIGVVRDPRTTYGDHKPHLYVDHAGLLYLFAFLYMGRVTADPDTDKQSALTETLALVGGPGTGKTEFFVWVAWLMDLPVVRISLSPSTDPFEFFGTPTAEKGEGDYAVTGFKRGQFSEAYERSCVIILDEANSAKDSIWYTLRPALDSAGQFGIPAENVLLEKDPYCFIGLAYNDVKASNRGTRELSAADTDRMVRYTLGLPSAEVERSIVQAHCADIGYAISDSTLDKIMNIAVELRAMNEDRTLPVAWTVRSNVRVAKMTLGLPLEMAYRLAVTEGLSQAQGEGVILKVRNYL